MDTEGTIQKNYNPVAVSRRSETISWGIVLFLIASIILLRIQDQNVPLAVTILAVFFSLAAVIISFGNWMEKRTTLEIGSRGIAYRNGVRKAALRWDQISEVRLDEDRLSKKVYVIGETGYFQFRLLSQPRYDGEVRGQFGFEEGQEILRLIEEHSGVRPTRQEKDPR